MKKLIQVQGYKRRPKGGSRKTVTVKAHQRSRDLTGHEYTELGMQHLIKSGFFSEEAQNRMRSGGKTQVLKNTENEVELINPKGVHILWIFKKYNDGTYHSVQFIIEEEPIKHSQLNKDHNLGEDEAHARKLWNSVIRHRRDLNERENGSKK